MVHRMQPGQHAGESDTAGKVTPILRRETMATRRSPPKAALLARLRAICLGFPEANERISHGEPTWFAGKGKVFAMFDNQHHGAEHVSVWLPQPIGVQETLIEADPERFFRPPYVGPSGWVGVVLDTNPDWNMVSRLVRDAFVHVATRKLIALLDGHSGPQTRTPAKPRPRKSRSRS